MLLLWFLAGALGVLLIVNDSCHSNADSPSKRGGGLGRALSEEPAPEISEPYPTCHTVWFVQFAMPQAALVCVDKGSVHFSTTGLISTEDYSKHIQPIIDSLRVIDAENSLFN